MTSISQPRARPASAGGAWLGFFVAARALGGVCVSIAPLVFVSGISMATWKVGEKVEENVAASEVPPELTTVIDLWSQVAQILGPFARIIGVSGVAIGVLLFFAAAALGRGSEFGRRAVRAMLVVDALHTVAWAGWMIVLATTTLHDWMNRYQDAVSKLLEVVPRGAGQMSMPIPGFVNAIAPVMWCLFSLSVAGALWWLAGRPYAREWCAARSGKRVAQSPIATGSPPL